MLSVVTPCRGWAVPGLWTPCWAPPRERWQCAPALAVTRLWGFGFLQSAPALSLGRQRAAGRFGMISREELNLWLALSIKSNHCFQCLVCPFLGRVYSKLLWLGGCLERATLRALRIASASHEGPSLSVLGLAR